MSADVMSIRQAAVLRRLRRVTTHVVEQFNRRVADGVPSLDRAIVAYSAGDLDTAESLVDDIDRLLDLSVSAPQRRAPAPEKAGTPELAPQRYDDGTAHRVPDADKVLADIDDVEARLVDASERIDGARRVLLGVAR